MLPTDIDAELDSVCNSLQNLSLSSNLHSSLTTALSPRPEELGDRPASVPPSASDEALPKPFSAFPLLQVDLTSTRSSATDEAKQDP
jgi:hypothetical protein